MENNKEIGVEKEIGSFENIPEKKDNTRFEKKEDLKIEEDIRVKSIDEIAENKNISSKENNIVLGVTEEEKKVDFLVKKSQGVDINKLVKIISFVKKKLTPFGIDSYHDKITKRKNG